MDIFKFQINYGKKKPTHIRKKEIHCNSVEILYAPFSGQYVNHREKEGRNWLLHYHRLLSF